MVESDGQDNEDDTFGNILGDLEYMNLPETTDYLLRETDFLDQILDIFTLIYNKNVILMQEQHVLFDGE